MSVVTSLFNNDLPTALSNNPELAKEINAIYCFEITGTGTWTVDLQSEPPSCFSGDSGNSQCRITVSSSDFEEMLKDPQVGMQLYFQGKMTVEGDPMLATQLQQVIGLAFPHS